MKYFRNLRDGGRFAPGLLERNWCGAGRYRAGLLRASGRAAEECAGFQRVPVPKREEILTPAFGVFFRAEMRRRSDGWQQYHSIEIGANRAPRAYHSISNRYCKLLETALTASVSIRSAFLIATICPIFSATSPVTQCRQPLTSAKICPRRTPGSASGTR
jgi:hypothetical protein